MPPWMDASLAWVDPQAAAGRREPEEKATFRFPEDVARFVSGRSGPANSGGRAVPEPRPSTSLTS